MLVRVGSLWYDENEHKADKLHRMKDVRENDTDGNEMIATFGFGGMWYRMNGSSEKERQTGKCHDNQADKDGSKCNKYGGMSK